MKSYIITFLAALLVASSTYGQITFEKNPADSGLVLNGKNGETSYLPVEKGSTLYMPTFWDTSFGGFWASGWALSKKLDSATVSVDFARHMYCVKAFSGANNSKGFAVGQNGTSFHLQTAASNAISGFMITNTTAAYNSMKLGDFFAKKFGGKSGNDSDYFVCRIKSFSKGVLKDSQDVYLADFRFQDNAKDYILSSWQPVSFANSPDSVSFEMYSSDNGAWGMNTPAFFAIDNIELSAPGKVSAAQIADLNVFPNPSAGNFVLASADIVYSVKVSNAAGVDVMSINGVHANTAEFVLENKPEGLYFLEVQTSKGRIVKTVLLKP
jgi:hypothetical protein